MDLSHGLPFGLLWLALVAAMFPRLRRAWPVLVNLSVAAAVAVGVVEWTGLAVIALLAGSCLAAMRSSLGLRVRALAWGGVLVCAIALATHEVPGIHNVLLFDSVTLSSGAAPYTLYWNYDKALAGVLLYALCVQPQRPTQWRRAALATAVLVVLTPALAVVLAMAANYVVWEPKWPILLPLWIPANLLVTCVAEEVLFRGILQRYLARALQRAVSWAGLAALLVSAAAFGIAHIAGGVTYAVLAGIAGVGYGAAYHATQRVEASIVVHFSVNVTHLLLFTYPSVAVQ